MNGTVEEDYLSVRRDITFEPVGLLEHCVAVPIINDSVLEDAEMFTVSLESSDEVVFGLSQSTVVIADDDCKIKYM